MTDKIEKLKEMQQLLDEGTITSEEFAQMKQELLSGNVKDKTSPVKNLARKKIWIAIILSLVIPFTGYAYTGRWKALLVFFSFFCGMGFVIGVTSKDAEKAFANSFRIASILGPIVAAVDNGVAINKARINSQ
ncbi:SHOCT domain-containing protein [Okeania sp. SIO1F9]|uniref:SHOCT domain-containing protein n=1 Tax=Okeania sp. SIO1F9 TaxID=2607813 RepID=UPI0014508C03|nr:SHOCT domain-containing protein [Okeania sp. SIO1F9]NET76633.1 hypothetical protein [Okeania sp. SIO1F9]